MLYSFHKATLFLMLAAAVMLSACMKDDGVCQRGRVVEQSIGFEYVMNDSGRDLLEEQVESLHLLIYDTYGTLSADTTVITADLLPGNRIQLTLREGIYTAVVWGNNNEEHYKVERTPAIESLYLELITTTGYVGTEYPELFQGVHTFTAGNGEETLSLQKHSNHITVKLLGVYLTGSKLKDSRPEVMIKSPNGRYGFDNKVTDSARELRYIPDISRSGYAHVSQFHTLTILSGEGTVLSITDQEGILEPVDISLYKLIKTEIYDKIASPQFDFEEFMLRVCDFTLEITIEEQSDGKYKITITDWNVIIGGGSSIG